MAYIGKTPVIGNFVKLDSITVVNGQAAYTMQNGGVNFTSYDNVNQFLVSLNGVLQAPTDSFTVSGSTLTFASNLSTGDVIDFVLVLGNSLDIGTPSDNTVTTAKIVDDAVTSAKIADDSISDEHLDVTAITGQTAETSVADDDTILIHDTSASALRKMTKTNFVGSVGGMTLLHTFTTSGATSFTQNITTTGYNTLYGTIQSINHASLVPDFYIQFNSDTGNNYRYLRTVVDSAGNMSTSYADVNGIYYNFTGVDGFDPVNNAGAFFLHNPTTTGYKSFQQVSGGARSGSEIVINTSGIYVSSAAITSIQVKSSSTVTGGTVKIYGMK